MVNFTFAFADLDEKQREKIIIAACFHDIGIWPEKTLDYIPPSIKHAKKFLTDNGLEDWNEQIGCIIGEHHKVRKFNNDPLVEVFRKGDLVDFSLGIINLGLPRSFVKDVKSAFPNNGFHKCLVGVAAKWIIRNPLNPIPVLKW